MRRDLAFIMTTAFHQPLLAMATLGWMVFCANSVQAVPIINDNFTADITVTRLDTTPRGLAQQYTWYEWYTGHLSRFDVINPDDSVEKQVFQFLPGNPLSSCNGTPITIPMPGKNGRKYTYNVAKNRCKKRVIPKDFFASRPAPHSTTMGFWDFSAQATNSGTCHSRIGNNMGTLWTSTLPESNKYTYTEIGVCVASDNATPYWVAWRGPSQACSTQPHQGPPPTCELIEMLFNSFTPGIPPINNFCPSPDAATACGLP
jgi:hypothetical protein